MPIKQSKTKKVITRKNKKKKILKLQVGLFALTTGLALILTILFYPYKSRNTPVTNESIYLLKNTSEIYKNYTSIPLLELNAADYLLSHVDSTFNNVKLDQLENNTQMEFLVLSGKLSTQLYKEYQSFNTQKKMLESNIKTIELNPHLIDENLINIAISCVFRYISLYKRFIVQVNETVTKEKGLDTLIVYFDYFLGFSMISEYINFKTSYDKIILPLISNKINTLNTNKVLNNIISSLTNEYTFIIKKLINKVQMGEKTDNKISTKGGYYFILDYNKLNEYLSDNLILILLLLFKFNEKGEIIDYESLFSIKMNKLKEENEKDYIELNESFRKYLKDLIDALTEESKSNYGQNDIEVINKILDTIIIFCDKNIIDTNALKRGLF